jgi:hypothetical protein
VVPVEGLNLLKELEAVKALTHPESKESILGIGGKRSWGLIKSGSP